jgi:hypothetical protein
MAKLCVFDECPRQYFVQGVLIKWRCFKYHHHPVTKLDHSVGRFGLIIHVIQYAERKCRQHTYRSRLVAAGSY